MKPLLMHIFMRALQLFVVGVTLVKLVEEPMLELLGIIFTLLGILVFIFGFIKSNKNEK